MTYTGRATKTGNSKGFRFEKALFASHPEFAEGDFEADVIAPGRLLIRARLESEEPEADPVLETFLAFLADQMQSHPERIGALTDRDVEGLDELLAGVEYDYSERLPEDFELP